MSSIPDSWYSKEHAWAAPVWDFCCHLSRLWEQPCGCQVVQVPARGYLQHCLGRVQSGGCVLRVTLSSYQRSLCPKICPGVENRAVCSPLGANISRKLLLPVAGPRWAQRPDRGLCFACPSCARAPLWHGMSWHLPKTIISPSTFIPSNEWNRWPVGWGSS